MDFEYMGVELGATSIDPLTTGLDQSNSDAAWLKEQKKYAAASAQLNALQAKTGDNKASSSITGNLVPGGSASTQYSEPGADVWLDPDTGLPMKGNGGGFYRHPTLDTKRTRTSRSASTQYSEPGADVWLDPDTGLPMKGNSGGGGFYRHPTLDVPQKGVSPSPRVASNVQKKPMTTGQKVAIAAGVLSAAGLLWVGAKALSNGGKS